LAWCYTHFNPGSSIKVPLAPTAWPRPRGTWNAPRIFQFWVSIDWFHLWISSFLKISRFGVIKCFSSRLWMDVTFFHLNIDICGGLARCNAHFNPGICIGMPSAPMHRQGPRQCWKSVNTLWIFYTSLVHSFWSYTKNFSLPL
jgi:hypothetical protein